MRENGLTVRAGVEVAGFSTDLLLKKESEKLGKETKKVFDQNYGEVNAYHISVWESLYFDSINY